jgi:hypothetical protein
MEPYGLRSGAKGVRTIAIMLWRSRNEAGAGRSSWATHRQSRWWDWVEGLSEPVESTSSQPEADQPERTIPSRH